VRHTISGPGWCATLRKVGRPRPPGAPRAPAALRRLGRPVRVGPGKWGEREGLPLPREGLPKPSRGKAQPSEGNAIPSRGKADPSQGSPLPSEGKAKPSRGITNPSQGFLKHHQGFTKPSRGKSLPSEGLPYPFGGEVSGRSLDDFGAFQALPEPLRSYRRPRREGSPALRLLSVRLRAQPCGLQQVGAALRGGLERLWGRFPRLRMNLAAVDQRLEPRSARSKTSGRSTERAWTSTRISSPIPSPSRSAIAR
jgi:hypothetical protein